MGWDSGERGGGNQPLYLSKILDIRNWIKYVHSKFDMRDLSIPDFLSVTIV